MKRYVKHICPHCQKEFEVYVAYLNKANSIGAPRYCSKACSGLARRKGITPEQFKANKAAYDKEYRLREGQKEKHRASWKKNYNPVKAAEYRKKRMPIHVEYCRQPEYKEKKIVYDREHRAKKLYGEHWESAILIEQINNKLIQMADKADLRQIQGTNSKSQRRKRQWLRMMTNLRQLT